MKKNSSTTRSCMLSHTMAAGWLNSWWTARTWRSPVSTRVSLSMQSCRQLRSRRDRRTSRWRRGSGSRTRTRVWVRRVILKGPSQPSRTASASNPTMTIWCSWSPRHRFTSRSSLSRSSGWTKFWKKILMIWMLWNTKQSVCKVKHLITDGVRKKIQLFINERLKCNRECWD